MTPKLLARGAKRLDLCAAQFAFLFHLSGRGDLENKNCLEVGSGWVLSHAIICYLLGADHVYATDISPNAYPPVLKEAIRGAVPSIVRDILSPFCDHEKVRDRLDRLLAIDKFSFKTLEDIGIEYVASIDLAHDTIDEKFDFIYSLSVMQHIPYEDVQNVIERMVSILSPSGFMIHAIHLEDIKNFRERPFDFYAEPDENYPPTDQTTRGNRIRKSQWLKNFQVSEELEVRILYEFKREDKEIPRVISPSIRYIDENDLRVSHLGLLVSK